MSLVELLGEPSTITGGRTRRIGGVAVGIVVDNEDPEGLGRVKLRFPWLAEETESDWSKVVSLGAGKGRGAFFLPEVEDEVLVAFEQGDLDHAYVIGGLWSADDEPPATNEDGRNDVRLIRSRSGHEIILTDGEEKCTVEIRDQTGSNRIELDSMSGTVSVEAETKVSIKAPQIEIQASTSLKVESSGPLTVKGQVVRIN